MRSPRSCTDSLWTPSRSRAWIPSLAGFPDCPSSRAKAVATASAAARIVLTDRVARCRRAAYGLGGAVVGDSGTTREEDSGSRLTDWVASCGCAGAFFFVLRLLFITLSSGSGGGCGVTGGTDHPDQAVFQAKVVDDRRQLFDGRLTYRSSLSIDVDSSITYEITLRALGQDTPARRVRSNRPRKPDDSRWVV